MVVARNAARDILRKRSVHLKDMADIQEPKHDDIEGILANTDSVRIALITCESMQGWYNRLAGHFQGSDRLKLNHIEV